MILRCHSVLQDISKLMSSWQKPTSLAVEDRCQEAVRGVDISNRKLHDNTDAQKRHLRGTSNKMNTILNTLVCVILICNTCHA